MAPFKGRRQYTAEDLLEFSVCVLGYISLSPEHVGRACRPSMNKLVWARDELYNRLLVIVHAANIYRYKLLAFLRTV